jgi:PAS domain S-box-containing protein
MPSPGSGPTAVGTTELVDLLESSRDLALIVDVSGQIRWANAAARQFGRIESVEVLMQAPHLLRAFLTEAAFRTVVRDVLPVLAAGTSWSGELTGLRPDGVTVPLSVSAVAHRHPDGSVESFSAIGHDLSSVQAVVRSLGTSELRMRTLVEAAPIGIFETNAAGACTYVNPAFCRIAGVERPEDAFGLGWGSRVHPDDATRVGSAWATAVHLDTPFSEQFRFVTASGDVVWADVEALPVHDEAGRTTMFLGTIDDVTERSRLERDRYESSELFSAAFHHAPTGMVLTDVSAGPGEARPLQRAVRDDPRPIARRDRRHEPARADPPRRPRCGDGRATTAPRRGDRLPRHGGPDAATGRLLDLDVAHPFHRP